MNFHEDFKKKKFLWTQVETGRTKLKNGKTRIWKNQKLTDSPIPLSNVIIFSLLLSAFENCGSQFCKTHFNLSLLELAALFYATLLSWVLCHHHMPFKTVMNSWNQLGKKSAVKAWYSVKDFQTACHNQGYRFTLQGLCPKATSFLSPDFAWWKMVMVT